MNDIREIQRMTIAEYNLRMKAYRLAVLDREHDIALQAWMNREIQATKKSGRKYVSMFTNFKQFFNYEEREKKILCGETGEQTEIDDMKTRYREFMRSKHGND